MFNFITDLMMGLLSKLIRLASKKVLIFQKLLTRYTSYTPIYPQFNFCCGEKDSRN